MRHPIDLRRVLYALRLAGPSDRDSILRFQRAAIAAIDPGTGEEAVLDLEDGTLLPYLIMWKHALPMRAPG